MPVDRETRLKRPPGSGEARQHASSQPSLQNVRVVREPGPKSGGDWGSPVASRQRPRRDRTKAPDIARGVCDHGAMSQEAVATGRTLARRRRWRPPDGFIAELLLYLTALACMLGLIVSLLRGSLSAVGAIDVVIGLPVLTFAVVKGRRNISDAKRELQEDRPTAPSDRSRLHVAVFLFVWVMAFLVLELAVIPASS